MPGPGHSIGELPSSDQIVNSLEFQTFAQAIMARAREGSNNSVRETGGVVLYDYRTGGYHFIHYPYRGDRTSINLYPLPNIPIRKSPIDRKKVEPIGIPVAIIHSHPDPHQVKNGVGPSNLDVTNSQQPYPGNDNTSQNFFKGRVFPWYIIGKDLADGIYGVWVVNPGGIVTGPHKSPAPPIVNFK